MSWQRATANSCYLLPAHYQHKLALGYKTLLFSHFRDIFPVENAVGLCGHGSFQTGDVLCIVFVFMYKHRYKLVEGRRARWLGHPWKPQRLYRLPQPSLWLTHWKIIRPPVIQYRLCSVQIPLHAYMYTHTHMFIQALVVIKTLSAPSYNQQLVWVKLTTHSCKTVFVHLPTFKR